MLSTKQHKWWGISLLGSWFSRQCFLRMKGDPEFSAKCLGLHNLIITQVAENRSKGVSCKQRSLSPTHCLGDLLYVWIHFDGVPQVSERWRNEKRGRWRVAPWSRDNELRIQGIADVCEVLLQERYQDNRIIRIYLKPELWSVVPSGCLSPRS